MFKIISTSTTGIVQRFGKVVRSMDQGLNWYIPFVEKVVIINNRLKEDVFDLKIKTKDNVFCNLKIGVQYCVKPQDSAKAYFSLDDYKNQLDSYVKNAIRSKAPELTLDSLYSSQSEICEDVSKHLSIKLKEYGFTIENTLITDIQPADEVVRAMNKINETERLQKAAENETAAYFTKEVGKAKADKERKRLQGEGTAAQRDAIMKGYEEGIHTMSKSFGVSSQEIINFLTNIQHIDMQGEIAKSPNTKVLFLGSSSQNQVQQLISGLEVSR